MNLKDKVVVITGGSQGFGKALAQGFLKEGSRVVISSHDKKNLQSTAEELSADYFTADATSFVVFFGDEMHRNLRIGQLFFLKGLRVMGKLLSLIHSTERSLFVLDWKIFSVVCRRKLLRSNELNVFFGRLCCRKDLPCRRHWKKFFYCHKSARKGSWSEKGIVVSLGWCVNNSVVDQPRFR